MPDLSSRTVARYSMNVQVKDDDGNTLEFAADDSLRSWWSIVRWNANHGYWRLVFHMNLPDLFTKVLRRKLWRRSA